jgi:Tfp pilus assembly protein PilF
MQRCHELIRAGEFDAARARLIPIVTAHPRWQRATFLLGLSYHEEQRYGEARPLFARALALDPASDDTTSIAMFYGWTLYYLGEPDAARRQFETVLARRPEDPESHFALGLIDYDADDLAAATRRLEAAIALAGARADARAEGKARARLADVYVRRGELARARELLEAAVRLRPDAYEAYHKLATVLERLGDAAGAARARARHREVREQVRPSSGP